MSPEQARGEKLDPRTDLFSFGAVLYEMATGQQAFPGETSALVFDAILNREPTSASVLRPKIPLKLEEIIQKALEKDRKLRYQNASDLRTDLLRLKRDTDSGRVAAPAEKAEAKPAVISKEVELPLHLTRWQRRDWLLVAAAVAGLALFFPFFNRTSLAARSKVSFTRSVLFRVAEEYAQRLGAPLGKEGQVGVHSVGRHQYDYVAQRAGARKALDLANNPVPIWVWTVGWDNGTEVGVDNRGSLQTFSRDFPVPNPGGERLSTEEARPLAEKALREFFNRDPAPLVLETAAADTWRGHEATSFTWIDPNDYQGLKRRYVVRFVGREAANLDSRFDLPGGYVWRNTISQSLSYIAVFLVVGMLGFSQRQKADLGARWRIGVAALAFVGGGWTAFHFFSTPETLFKIALSVFLGLANLVMFLFMSVAVERAVRRVAPARFAIFVRLFDRRAASEPCGLAILRGTFVGVALLGADTFLVWLGTNHFGMQLDFLTHFNVAEVLLSNPLSSGDVVAFALRDGLLIMAAVAFLASFVARFVRRSWLAVFLAAALAAAALAFPSINMGAVQPYHCKYLVVLFDCLALVWAFTSFDVLTMSWAAFTFAFCWANYYLLVMLEPTGAFEQWAAFGVFGLLVAAAAAIAFKSSLLAAKRRLATAFE